MERAGRIERAVGDAGEGDVRVVVTSDEEVFDPDVVCAGEEDDDEGCDFKKVQRRASTRILIVYRARVSSRSQTE